MKPRKPDRFERAVSRIVKSDEDVGYTDFCFSRDVVNLLRKEHAWMKRMVRRCLKGATDTGYVIACSSILAQLAQRRK